MIIFSDLHLKEANEHIVWEALAKVEALALDDPDKRVVFCGDWWQLRYQVSVRLLNKVHKLLANWVELGLEVDLIPGNHDQVTVDGVNALEILAREGVEVWTEPGIGLIDDHNWAGYVPYRKDPEDQLEALEAVWDALREQKQEFPVIFGHFGLRGATMNNGKKDRDGFQIPVRTGKALLVLGHYHGFQWLTQAEGLHGISSVVYVGSVFQHTFGEAGNAIGAARLRWGTDGWTMDHIPLDVGPKHYIVSWDLSACDQPPAPAEGVRPEDKVRLDIKAPPSLISPDLIGVIKEAGYEGAQVNVEPVAEKREHRFAMVDGESLVEAAERFVTGRDVTQSEAVPLIAKLHEWAGC